MIYENVSEILSENFEDSEDFDSDENTWGDGEFPMTDDEEEEEEENDQNNFAVNHNLPAKPLEEDLYDVPETEVIMKKILINSEPEGSLVSQNRKLFEGKGQNQKPALLNKPFFQKRHQNVDKVPTTPRWQNNNAASMAATFPNNNPGNNFRSPYSGHQKDNSFYEVSDKMETVSVSDHEIQQAVSVLNQKALFERGNDAKLNIIPAPKFPPRTNPLRSMNERAFPAHISQRPPAKTPVQDNNEECYEICDQVPQRQSTAVVEDCEQNYEIADQPPPFNSKHFNPVTEDSYEITPDLPSPFKPTEWSPVEDYNYIPPAVVSTFPMSSQSRPPVDLPPEDEYILPDAVLDQTPKLEQRSRDKTDRGPPSLAPRLRKTTPPTLPLGRSPIRPPVNPTSPMLTMPNKNQTNIGSSAFEKPRLIPSRKPEPIPFQKSPPNSQTGNQRPLAPRSEHPSVARPFPVLSPLPKAPSDLSRRPMFLPKAPTQPPPLTQRQAPTQAPPLTQPPPFTQRQAPTQPSPLTQRQVPTQPPPFTQRQAPTQPPPPSISSSVTAKGSLENQAYFFGNFDRTKAIKELDKYKKEGMFIIRNTSRGEAGYSITIYSSKECSHLKIPYNDGCYSLGDSKRRFDTVEEMIAFYQKTMITLKNGSRVCLSTYYPTSTRGSYCI